jgi:hypothetical protein
MRVRGAAAKGKARREFDADDSTAANGFQQAPRVPSGGLRSQEDANRCSPRSTPVEFRLDRERIEYWVARGAQLSPTVKSLLEQAKS